ncbi:MAG: amidohydrolase [Planctomycetes bacterium]|nr:amidohydrolase [Planctomycetota bacterium]
MSTENIQAIDVHAHYGKYDRGKADVSNDFMTGDAGVVVGRARQANIRLTVVSPLQALLPRFGGDPVGGNRDAARVVAETDGLLQWVVVDPLKPETYAQADEMLQLPKCVGIKIHPEEHGYFIAEHGEALFSFAAKHRAVVLAHSSEQRSLASDYVTFANAFPEMTLIIAHLGCGWDGDLTHQVRAIQQNKHGNLVTDTSSARSITPKLIEWGVREVGAERILFGTDTPLYFTAMQRSRIDCADISDHDKQLILRDNAVRLLRLNTFL